MMKSAIDWLMGKSSTTDNEHVISTLRLNVEAEHQANDDDFSKENSVLNGHFSDTHLSSNRVSTSDTSEHCRSGEEVRSPWGRTLTPKSPKYTWEKGIKRVQIVNSGRSQNLSLRNKSSKTWEDISFASEVTSPGFATRIAKEGRVKKQLYDGSRKYPVGQDKFIRTGILPNVRLKGHAKPVVLARRAPSSPLLPLSSSSPFSSTLTSGFLSSASTRMPDISSVVSVLDSTPSISSNESIKDPTSVQAVVAALEQAQNVKSGVKRSRYMEPEDSNKKQKGLINSGGQGNISSYPISIITKNIGGGGEKRPLDISPSSSTENSPTQNLQLSPENKRRCIPDPRVASFSSSKNLVNNISMSGRESPFFMYESHQDSDSESNKSLDSQRSPNSEHSFRGQNVDLSGGIISKPDQFDRSGSQTPQSQSGSYCVSGLSNGSSSSSRTTTPSRPSHAFSLEAYKADKAKSQQRLNKMLGMLFNVSDDEALASIEAQKLASSTIDLNTNSTKSSVSEPVESVPSTTFPKITSGTIERPSDILTKEVKDKNEDRDISASFTFTIKPPLATVPEEPSVTSVDSSSKSEASKVDTPSSSVGTCLTDLLSKGQTLSASNIGAAASFTIPKVDHLQKSIGSLKNSFSVVSESSTLLFPAPTSLSSSSPSTDSSNNVNLSQKNTPTFTISNEGSANKTINESSQSTSVSNPVVSNASANFKAPLFTFGSSNKEASKSDAPTPIPSLGSSSNSLFQFSSVTPSNSTVDTPITSSFSSPPPSYSFGNSKINMAMADKNFGQSTLTQPSSLFSFGSTDSSNSVTQTTSTATGVSTSTISNIFNFGSSQVTRSNDNKLLPSATINNSLNPVSNSAQPLFSFGSNITNKSTSSGGISTTNVTTTSAASIGSGLFSFGNTTKSEKSNNPVQDSPFSFGQSQIASPSNQSTFTGNAKNFTSPTPIFGPSGGGFSFSPKVPTSTNTISTSSASFSYGSTVSPSASKGFNFSSISSSQPFTFTPTTRISAPTTTVSSSSSSVSGSGNSDLFSFGNNATKPSTGSKLGSFGDSNIASIKPTFAFGSQNPAESSPFGGPSPFGTTPTTDIKNSGTNIFGPSNSNSTPSFGSSGISVASPFNATEASSLFGNGGNNNGTSTFGAKTTANMFGANNTNFGSSNISSPSPSSTFGSSKTPSTTFGATNAVSPAFGSNATSTTFGSNIAPPTFGSNSASTTFGSNSASTTFGSNAASTTFGSNAASTTFGSNAASTTFGSNAATATFGSTNTSAYGSQNAPAFAAPSNATQTFGSNPPTFGSSVGGSSSFGSSSAPTFGSSSTGTGLPQLGSLNSTATFGQTTNAFSFGQSQASTVPGQGIFQFGSTGPSQSMPSFSPGPGTPGDPSAALARRPKAKAHRRR